MNRFFVVALFGFALFSGRWIDAGEKPKPGPATKDEKKVFELTNEERKKKELKPLVLNATLCMVARSHSENMAAQGKLAHDLDGKSAFDRMRSAGYKFVKGGENVGAGDGITPEGMVKAWMGSDGHRGNILTDDYTELGVGIARAKNGQLYYTQVFARPAKK
jgi:uncharacterized protein YkwD